MTNKLNVEILFLGDSRSKLDRLHAVQLLHYLVPHLGQVVEDLFNLVFIIEVDFLQGGKIQKTSSDLYEDERFSPGSQSRLCMIHVLIIIDRSNGPHDLVHNVLPISLVLLYDITNLWT